MSATKQTKVVKCSDLFVQALENEGVEYIFGIPGEENLDFLESLQTSKKIRLVLTRHEQGAGFMAATVGRLTGKIGVCLSTLGPGATNFVTAAAYANLAGFPMLMLTGQKPIRVSKQGHFQIIDIVENFRPVTKYTKQIADGNRVPAMVREAIRRGLEEKPGAVHLELPEDIARQECTQTHVFPVQRVRRPVAEGKAISRAVELIEHSRRPLLLIGAGANRKLTRNMLREFVDEIGIPFISTQMGKGVVDERHPLYIGCCALSARDYVHAAIDAADLIINVGHDVVEKPPFFMKHDGPPTVIHVNFYGATVDDVYFPHHEVVGDIANAMWQLKTSIKKQPHWNFSYYLKVRDSLEESLRPGRECSQFPLSVQRVVGDTRKAVPEDGLICLDNGMYKIWFARAYKAMFPNTVLLDNALATMGAGLPSAIAASMLCPERKVVAVCGDGGFMMNSQELETAVREKLNLTVLVLNDSAFGMIKWKQQGMGFQQHSLDFGNPNLVDYAQSYGAHGHRVMAVGDLERILQHCLNTNGVHVIDCPITYADSDEYLNSKLATEVDALKAMKASYIRGDVLESPATPHDLKKIGAFSAAPKPEPNFDGLDNYGKLRKRYPFYLGNEAVEANADLAVTNKYTGRTATYVALANETHIDRAISAAQAAAPAVAAMGSFERKAVLEHVVRRVRERFEEFAVALCIEAGKPIRDSRGEVQRLIDTFVLAAEESTRVYGEFQQMDISARNKGYQAIVRRFPIGPISMVSPFNFPLNLAAHKIAPAIACGCPWVLKPASRTPLGALMLGEILAETQLPKGSFSILPCSRDGADLFTVDERFKLLSFTGSPEVGWRMKSRAGKKKVVLELGGNAACVIDSYEDLEAVVKRVVFGGFYQSGQSCISVQRIFVRQDLYRGFRDALVAQVSQLVVGDPLKEETFIGPLISEGEAVRIEGWVREAVEKGAHLLTGGARDGAFVSPAVLEEVPRDSKVYSEEVFGPVVCIQPYTDFKKVIEEVNASKFGLQVGVYTADLHKAFYAYEHSDVGGVVINDVPSFRVDSQPYGGVKESGIGREGIRYAIEDMTEIRTMMLKDANSLN